MKKTQMVKGLLILLTMMAMAASPLGAQIARAEQIVSYDWESGTGSVLGTYGNVWDASNSTEQAHTGSRSLKIVEDPVDETPQAFIFWVTGLTDGDTVEAGFWVYDITPGDNPSGRIWGHYTAGNDINSYAGSASGNYTYSDGSGWSELSYTWTFDSATNSRDGLIVEARIYSAEEQNIIYVDDAEIIVSNDDAHIYTPASIPAVGELVINEIMYFPTTDDGADEWFEVVNVSGEERVINNCILTDDGQVNHSFVSHILQPNHYFVYGANSSTVGVTADYVYGVGRAFADTEDGDIITLTCNGVVVDAVNYQVGQNGWPASEGVSISFGIPDTGVGNYHLDNDSGSNWGDSTSMIGGGNSDLGTPGALNDDVLGPNAINLTSLAGESDSSVPFVFMAGGAVLLFTSALLILRRHKTV